MNDLAEVLRNFEGSDDLGSGDFSVLREAAHEIDRLTAERDALRARIEGAMVVKATRNGIVRSEARMNLIGKRVALVVLEGGK